MSKIKQFMEALLVEMEEGHSNVQINVRQNINPFSHSQEYVFHIYADGLVDYYVVTHYPDDTYGFMRMYVS